jgi:hypothetical protein
VHERCKWRRRKGLRPAGGCARRHHGGGDQCPLSNEAVRKGDVQEPMRERPGSAVGFGRGLDFHTERAQAALIASMSGAAPRMAIIRFRLWASPFRTCANTSMRQRISVGRGPTLTLRRNTIATNVRGSG